MRHSLSAGGSTSASGKKHDMRSQDSEYTAELLRHFADLRDGTHGDATSREDKERLFAAAVELLDPHARQALTEINSDLLLDTGEITATGIQRGGDGVDAIWALSWPEQRAAGIDPIVIRAFYGSPFYHPPLPAGAAAGLAPDRFAPTPAGPTLSQPPPGAAP